MKRVVCIIAVLLGFASSDAQEPAPADNPFVPAVVSADDSTSGDQSVPGSVTFAFDGGTLRCSFGALSLDATRHITMIVYPSSVEAMTKQVGIPIKRRRDEAIVITSGDDRKFVQLTSTSVAAWSKARIGEMSGRRSSVAENSFVSAVVHALSNDLAVSLWGSDAEEALEAGNWSRLFDTKRPTTAKDSLGDPFGGDGDPFR